LANLASETVCFAMAPVALASLSFFLLNVYS